MSIRLLSALILLCAAPAVPAQVENLDFRLPLTIDADRTEYDGIAGTVVYTGVRFSQGSTSIEADEGVATVRDPSGEGKWRFTGNVIIRINQGEIRCQSADLVFEQSVLSRATVAGRPATFELRREGANDATRARAERLHYNVRTGVIEFSGAASITEAGNQIASSSIVYNINERRINADSSGNGNDRVRITYTPEEPPAEASDDADEESGNE